MILNNNLKSLFENLKTQQLLKSIVYTFSSMLVCINKTMLKKYPRKKSKKNKKKLKKS